MKNSYDDKLRSLINKSLIDDLGYRFILEEVKRDKQLLTPKQVEFISESLDLHYNRVLETSVRMDILDVDSKTKKVLQKNFKI